MIIKNHYLLHLLFNLINENEIVYYFPRIPCAFSLFFIQNTKNVMEVERERKRFETGLCLCRAWKKGYILEGNEVSFVLITFQSNLLIFNEFIGLGWRLFQKR